METGIYDKNGVEVMVGDRVRESHRISDGVEYDITVGVVEYIRGCHVLNLGVRGTYTFYKRYPVYDTEDQQRIWEVLK